MTVKAPADWAKLKQVLPKDVRKKLLAGEDFLTARTFGLLRFLSPATFRKVFEELGVELPEDKYEVDLWPKYPSADGSTEPDLVIRGDRCFVLVEVKHQSALGTDRDQLGREWCIAEKEAKKKGWTKTCLLMITNDSTEPTVPNFSGSGRCTPDEQIHDYYKRKVAKKGPSAKEIEETLHWRSWISVAAACKKIQEDPTSPHEKALLSEVYGYLDLIDLGDFSGWDYNLPELEAPPVDIRVFLTLSLTWPLRFSRPGPLPPCPQSVFLNGGD